MKKYKHVQNNNIVGTGDLMYIVCTLCAKVC